MTSVATINATIESAIGATNARTYSSYVASATSALTDREDAIKASLIDYAVSQGLSQGQAEDAIETAFVGTPEQAEVPVEDTASVRETVGATIDRFMSALSNAAAEFKASL